MKYFNGEIFLKNIANICSDVSFSKEQMEKLDEYARLLVEKNEVMNLTAITDPEGIAVKHFADCFTLAPYIVKTNPKTIADIGKHSAETNEHVNEALEEITNGIDYMKKLTDKRNQAGGKI